MSTESGPDNNTTASLQELFPGRSAAELAQAERVLKRFEDYLYVTERNGLVETIRYQISKADVTEIEAALQTVFVIPWSEPLSDNEMGLIIENKKDLQRLKEIHVLPDTIRFESIPESTVETPETDIESLINLPPQEQLQTLLSPPDLILEAETVVGLRLPVLPPEYTQIVDTALEQFGIDVTADLEDTILSKAATDVLITAGVFTDPFAAESSVDDSLPFPSKPALKN